MRKILVFLLFINITSLIIADYIVPQQDPVYPYIETIQSLNYSSHLNAIYPLYHDEIISELENIVSSNISRNYKKIAEYHLLRLSDDYKIGFNTSIYPLKSIPRSLLSIFNKNKTHRNLMSYRNDETKFSISGIIGSHYDMKNKEKHEYRFLKYYGIEIMGNIFNNLGFYSQFKKGHYQGNINFISEDPYTYTESGETWAENPERVNIQAEVDLKTKYLDASLGYGAIGLGHTNTSSIILNTRPSSYGYFKFYKQFNNFNYLVMNAQLFPDSVSVFNDYSVKSMAMQSLYYNDGKFVLGLGQTVLYGDKNIDLGYLTPLVWYKLIDFKYRSRDNVQMFLFSQIRLMNGMSIYSNFFIDDLKKSRLFTKYGFAGFAIQGGVEYTFPTFPIKIFLETTAVGPNTYAHKTNELCYTNDNQFLGYEYGANILTFATGLQYVSTKFITSIKYLNLQQGSVGSDPFTTVGYNHKFLEGDLSRMQIISAEVQFFLSYHLKLHMKYQYENTDDKVKNYLYSGIELKY